MNEELVNIDTEPNFTCWPDSEAPFLAVVFYMDAPAIREELYDMARRIDYTLDIHPGTEHGFCFPLRDVYSKAAAEKVHTHFMDMCARRLHA